MSDILAAVDVALGFVEGMSYDEFVRNVQTLYAVSFALGMIGEAARGIPQEIKDQHPEVPWQLMQSMRNVVVHEYFRIDRSIIWDTTIANLPQIVGPLRRMLESESS